MQDNDSLDEIRKRSQESLIQAKQEQLRDEFGMKFDPMDSRLSLEGQNEWLDYLPIRSRTLMRGAFSNWRSKSSR